MNKPEPDHTDAQIIETMKGCETVEQWNEYRDKYKEVRSAEWISQNIDSGLIGKSVIK